MGTFTLYYSAVEDSIKQARKTASVLDLYSKDMSAVASSCNAIADSGYGQTAQAMARKKAQDAITQKGKFEKLAQDLSELESFAKSQDQSLANTIDVAVSNYVGKRKWYQKVSDWIRSGYEAFLDRISGFPIVGKYVAHAIRVAEDWVTNSTIRIYNYFKYGNGKYIWSSLMAVANVFKSLMLAVGAAALIIGAATPAIAVIFTIGAIASLVALVLNFGNMMATVSSNSNALMLTMEYRQSTKDKDLWYNTKNDSGSLSYARYYGNVSSVKSWIEHRDFGGKTINGVMDVAGSVYSFTKYAATIISTVCSVTGALENAQYLKGADGKWIKGIDGKTKVKDGSFFENIRTSFAESAGAEFQRTPVRQQYARHNGEKIISSQDYGKAFQFKMFNGYGNKLEKYGLVTDNQYGSIVQFGLFNWYGKSLKTEGAIISRLDLGVMDVFKHIGTINKTASGIEKIVDYASGESTGLESAYQAGDATQGLLSNFEFVDAYTDDGMKGIGVVHDIVKDIVDHLSPKENAYAAYLKAHP